MIMKDKGKGLILFFLFTMHTLLLGAQVDERGVDTTGRGYQIGRSIGEWIPFLILFTLALLVIIRSYRLSQKDGDG